MRKPTTLVCVFTAVLAASFASGCHCTCGSRGASHAEPPPPNHAAAPAPAPNPTSAPAPAPAPHEPAKPRADNPSTPPEPSPRPSPGAEPAPARPEPEFDDSCKQDADCVIAEGMSCCGTCPAVPPFRAVNRKTYAQARERVDKQCAVADVDCSRHHCPSPTRGCRADAMCEAGHCAARTSASCAR